MKEITDFTHINEQGRAKMVDVTEKQETFRKAVARSTITMRPTTLAKIKNSGIAKGNVLAVAQVAGIMAAKNTSNWIPMCHPLSLTGADIAFSDNGKDELVIEATVKTNGKTGVEMEALTAASCAALTVYDMCKALEKEMVITSIRLIQKTGGKSGEFLASSEG